MWVKNTKYDKKHTVCFWGMEVEANKYKVNLFQRKSVYDILWGYKDPFLEFLVKATRGIHLPFDINITCPGQEGLTDFVQLQVSELVEPFYIIIILLVYY